MCGSDRDFVQMNDMNDGQPGNRIHKEWRLEILSDSSGNMCVYISLHTTDMTMHRIMEYIARNLTSHINHLRVL